MNTDTHRKLTTALFKNSGIPVNIRLIDLTNWTIDNAPIWTHTMNNFFTKSEKLNQNKWGRGVKNAPYDLFGIVTSGHRARNHDLRSGLFISAINARAMGVPLSHAFLATYAHYAADALSNRMVSRNGTEWRHIPESV
jgi:hypothetical protein